MSFSRRRVSPETVLSKIQPWRPYSFSKSSTPSADKRENPKFRKYFKKAVKNGSKSLLEDLFFHDPIYTLLMYAGIMLYSGTPPWILSITSFMIAVIMVSLLEVSYHEYSYYKFKRSLTKIGFEVESYYETRFLINKEKDPVELIQSVTKEFHLEHYFERDYCDTYFNNCFPTFSKVLNALSKCALV